MDKHLISYYIGILIVISSHIYMLYTGQMKNVKEHAYINLVASLMIAYYFLNKEGKINY